MMRLSSRHLSHLVWIVPGVLVIAVVALAVSSANARSRDAEYHQSLAPSIQVRSNDFQHLQEMAVRFSCVSDGISPHIEWSAGPEGTRSYAVIATDWDAPSPAFRLMTVPHWVLYNIPASRREIFQNAGADQLSDQNVVVGTAMGGTVGYLPPCPPLGRHGCQFRVYALDLDTIQPESSVRDDILAAMEGHILAYGELIGLRTAG